MTDRENWLRAVRFEGPEWIPCGVGFAPLTWHTHREKLEEVVLRHPLLFKGFKPGSVKYDEYGPVYREGEYFRDNWGCLWYNSIGGLEGQVVGHPWPIGARWSRIVRPIRRNSRNAASAIGIKSAHRWRRPRRAATSSGATASGCSIGSISCADSRTS